MSGFIAVGWRTVLSAVAVGALITLTSCAATPESAPTSSPSPSPTASEPEPYDGPVVFIGDELELLLPSADDILALVPDASGFTEPSDDLEQISDGYGPITPAICGAFYLEQSLGTLGARTLNWSRSADAEDDPLSLVIALQFADEEQAAARMDQLMEASAQCAEFDTGGLNTMTVTVVDDGDVRALAGVLKAESDWGTWHTVFGYVSVGNALVQLRTPFSEETPVDAEAVAEALRAAAADGKEELIAQLTAEPPASTEAPAADASVPWSEWTITAAGVGPLRYGDPIAEAVAGVPGAGVTEPAFPSGPWTLTSADGASSLRVEPSEDGTISQIIVGATSDWEDVPTDGASAPAANGVRVGDQLSAAIAAYPGGTDVHIISSGQYVYLVGDRSGHLIAFHTTSYDAEAVDAEIIGISATDATTWGDLKVE